MNKLISQRAALLFMVTALVVAILGILPLTPAQGAAILSITPITWDVIGLDSNNVNAGPDTFPVGARVCNTGDEPATNLVVTMSWDSANAYIDFVPGSYNTLTVAALPDGTCQDFYYNIRI